VSSRIARATQRNPVSKKKKKKKKTAFIMTQLVMMTGEVNFIMA
jgi:hypothetical protein